MTSPSSKRGYEHIHDVLRTVLIEKILPKEFPALVKACKPLSCYPVIIGGALVQRCARRRAMASWFIRDILSEDVDIKFVLTVPDPRATAGGNIALIEAIDAERINFRARIKRALENHIASIEKADNVGITVRENDAMLDSTLEVIKRAAVRQLEVTYIEATGGNATLPIMDMNLFTEWSVPHYKSYRDWVNSRPSSLKGKKRLMLPVPTFNQRGVLFATCAYAYYDTLRMCVDRMTYFSEKRTMYALTKLVRYIIKMICLWSIRHEAKLDKDILDMYKKAHRILASIDAKKIKVGITDPSGAKAVKYRTPQVVRVSSLLEKVVRVTNVDDLIKVVSKADNDVIPQSGGGNISFKDALGKLNNLVHPQKVTR